MRYLLTASAVALLLAACSQQSEPETENLEAEAPPANTNQVSMPAPMQATAPGDPIEDALTDASRPEEDRQLDAARHPAEVLTFAGLERGWHVADLAASGGYYSRVLSTAVGETGHVYAHNPTWVADRFPDTDAELAALTQTRSNMSHIVAPIESFTDAIAGELDAVFIVLFYHDTGWDGTDRVAMNEEIYAALRPGGVLVVIDHHAPAGTGLAMVDQTHRIDAETVRQEIEAAGFVLAASSNLLANPADDRTLSVFDPAVRRQTDRFLYRFEKPAD